MFFTDIKAEKRIKELQNLRYLDRKPLPAFKAVEDRTKQEKYPYDFECEFQVSEGSVIYGRDKYFWLKTEIVLPDFKEKKYVLLFDLGKHIDSNVFGFEALLFINGDIYQAVDGNHQEVFIDEKFSGQTIELALRLWTGLEGGGSERKITHFVRFMDQAFLDEDIDNLYYISKAILQTVNILDENDSVRAYLLKKLNEAINVLNWKSLKQSSLEALSIIHTALESMPKVSNVIVNAIGHTHIDVAWLWRLKHTREKSARSFATVIKLMEQYPEYIFLQTQPQVYEYVKEDYPKLYAKIKERIQEGRWEVDGAMWLESDANLPSGESLVRQILIGKLFMKEEFNRISEYLWLPDVFGYSWALPQILKKSGIDMFMTTKISWNQFNRMPHDTFVWKGIDGSEILTHFITTPDPNNSEGPYFYTYNGVIEPYTVKGIYDGYRDKNINNELLLAYGYGDGGGGVTRDMLEMIRCINKIPGLPHVRTGRADEFFKKLKRKFNSTKEYVHTWDGELYLEYHRGTYTSQARNKMWNRKLELKYKLGEFKSVYQHVFEKLNYPLEKFRNGWKIILRNQFHDIIPGSSIKEVYQDSEKEYEVANKLIEDILCNTETNNFSLFNESNFIRKNIIVDVTKYAENYTSVEINNSYVPIIATKENKIIEVEELLPLSITNIKFSDKILSLNHVTIKVGDNIIETPYYTIIFNEKGWLTSIFDKKNEHEIIVENKFGNQMILYEDKPMNWDAWDIDIFHVEKYEIVTANEIDIFEQNPYYTTLRFKYQFGASKIVQDMILYENNSRIDFKTEVDWHERQTLLRTRFDVDIRTTFAKFDIQYGNVMRPNNWNTSWDWARFESVGHQWADLSQNNYGVSLLNDSKYGYSIKDKTIQLSLLKGAVYPDPFADEGIHNFTYSLYPHKGGIDISETIEQAYEINAPIRVLKNSCDYEGTLFTIQSDTKIVVDAIKLAESGDGILIRLHESIGSSSKVTIKANFSYEKMIDTNLIEEEINDSVHLQGTKEFIIKPFEIKTIKYIL